MIGKTCLRGLGIVVLASLLLAPAAQAASLWSSLRLDGGNVLCELLQRITVIFQTEDGDNRGTIDPNG